MNRPLTSKSEPGSEHTLGAGTVGSTLSSYPRKSTLGDLPSIMETARLASVGNPLYEYMCEDRIETRWTVTFLKMMGMITTSSYVEQGTSWVVDSGDSIMLYTDPTSSPKFYHKWLSQFARRLSRWFVRTEQEKKREAEISKKVDEAIGEALGERAKEMFYLDQLATTPARQGRGQGSSLVKVFSAEADARQTPSYLLSSNIAANTRFYNKLGFFTVREFTLGEDDPDWHHPPVVIALMVREVPDGSSKYRD